MKLTGQSPDEVRGWDHEDLLGLLAYCELENEELDRRVQQRRPHAAAIHHASASGPTTNTTVYRFGSRAAPKR